MGEPNLIGIGRLFRTIRTDEQLLDEPQYGPLTYVETLEKRVAQLERQIKVLRDRNNEMSWQLNPESMGR